MTFLKKSLLRANVAFGTQNVASYLKLWFYCKDYFTILHNERDQRDMGINGFSERNLIQSNLVVLRQKGCDVVITLDLQSGFFNQFYTIKESKRYMKTLLVVFEKKPHMGQFDLFISFFNV